MPVVGSVHQQTVEGQFTVTPARLRKLAAMPSLERRVLAVGLVMNPLMLLVLRTSGTQGALRIVGTASSRHFERRRHEATPATVVLASRIGASVNRAARDPAPEVTCLARSLTTQILLQRRGIESSVRIGVASSGSSLGPSESDSGLLFHAWVEVAGVPVNDSLDVARTFTPFPLDGDSLSKFELRPSGSARSSRSRMRRSARRAPGLPRRPGS